MNSQAVGFLDRYEVAQNYDRGGTELTLHMLIPSDHIDGWRGLIDGGCGRLIQLSNFERTAAPEPSVATPVVVEENRLSGSW